MAAPSRNAQFTRLQKVLKKHYEPVVPDPNRPVLEHLLYACCLENAAYPAADAALAAMVHTYCDWNEIRVSSVRELAEVMAGLPDPNAAALRFKKSLQSVFEATYSFDLEELRKLNLGAAVERLEKLEGTTRFSTAYVVQSALGGHSIPIDSGTLAALTVVGLADEQDVASGTVAGLERAIAKNAGLEFGSLLHQLGADFVATPYAHTLHAILLEIEPGAKERLPSRRKKAEPEPAKPAEPRREQPAPSAEPPKAQKEEKSAKAKKKSKKESSSPAGEAPAPVVEPKKETKEPKEATKAGEAAPPGGEKGAKKKKADDKAKPPKPEKSKADASEGLSKRKPR